jgi:hypothetical protein
VSYYCWQVEPNSDYEPIPVFLRCADVVLQEEDVDASTDAVAVDADEEHGLLVVFEEDIEYTDSLVVQTEFLHSTDLEMMQASLLVGCDCFVVSRHLLVVASIAAVVAIVAVFGDVAAVVESAEESVSRGFSIEYFEEGLLLPPKPNAETEALHEPDRHVCWEEEDVVGKFLEDSVPEVILET